MLDLVPLRGVTCLFIAYALYIDCRHIWAVLAYNAAVYQAQVQTLDAGGLQEQVHKASFMCSAHERQNQGCSWQHFRRGPGAGGNGEHVAIHTARIT
eukprot:scaffold668106_cov141-Prasinocladus_malaysianus.AAC.1